MRRYETYDLFTKHKTFCGRVDNKLEVSGNNFHLTQVLVFYFNALLAA